MEYYTSIRIVLSGTTQREGMGREEGGGFRMGNTGIPVTDSFQYLAKLIQYCKVKKKKKGLCFKRTMVWEILIIEYSMKTGLF